MDSSADDAQVATAWNLHYLACTCVTLATFWTYDYISSLHEEWTFLLQSRWTKLKALYIVARYIPFFFIATDLYMIFTPNENPNKCRMLINIYSCLGVISLTCSECFFILRTYALWNKNRIVLVAMLSTLFAIIVSFIGIWFTAVATSDVITSTIPGTVGCYRSSSSVYFFVSFLLLFVLAVVLVFLTLIPIIQSWQIGKGRLHSILVKHNMFYYACSLFLSAVNVLTPVLSSYISINFFERFQALILAILATRMHLDLWRNNWHAHESDALECISMSDSLPADPTV
ncbi:uncharacterized protein F5891DRAFT_539520 [Suillus fuscotomentosus]|uniref:DUF6533 domain-containing protein n=1 Tax=Suillus fuscotomentosus TaxID=1912939 RepID=A0AAD4DZZ1_9AGAM|nr:uncharacterized protein F5891DRAFT_539520 [Suillus fuscotomentosus]KAG1897204.1 hypothetical protein F5891DRAFT_539520 [Suillus fuscotomentosus]